MRPSHVDVLAGVALLILVTITRAYSYLLFHSLVELFSIVIAFSIFLIAWNSKQSMDNDFLLFLGIVYLFVGIIDLFHTLAYKGMGVFPGFDSNLPTQLWITARYFESTGLLISTVFLKRKLRPALALALYASATSIALLSIFSRSFPVCYIEGYGLTVFKVASEYIIVLVLALSIIRIYRLRSLFDRHVLFLVSSSIAVTAFSELSFTLYLDVYGLFNMLGHILKLISFYLIYLSIVRVGITIPHALLFRATKENEERLQRIVEEKTRGILKLQERLLEIERGAAFGEVAASVIHDMKSPMQTLLNLVFMLRNSESVGRDEKLKGILDRIDQQISYLNNVTLELKQYAKPMKPSISPVDLNELLRGVLKSIEIPSNIKAEINLPEGLPKILADPIFMQRTFHNVILNAIEAMPGGGILRVSAEKEGNQLVVTVSDTGVGIAPEDKEKLFRPMFTTKKGGTGLGLAISKRLLESIGGSIDFTSEKGKGTTFRIRIPASDQA
ncbi:MAG: ATP-binding protein [Candidatus Methanosuratincola sp.]|nr:ATP-binding protein [Candidatus Methanosuratincola sp.]